MSGGIFPVMECRHDRGQFLDQMKIIEKRLYEEFHMDIIKEEEPQPIFLIYREKMFFDYVTKDMTVNRERPAAIVMHWNDVHCQSYTVAHSLPNASFKLVHTIEQALDKYPDMQLIDYADVDTDAFEQHVKNKVKALSGVVDVAAIKFDLARDAIYIKTATQGNLMKVAEKLKTGMGNADQVYIAVSPLWAANYFLNEARKADDHVAISNGVPERWMRSQYIDNVSHPCRTITLPDNTCQRCLGNLVQWTPLKHSLELMKLIYKNEAKILEDGKKALKTVVSRFSSRTTDAKSFNYLLLDPRFFVGSEIEDFRSFVSSIFYVGKGKENRPFDHLADALKLTDEELHEESNKKAFRINSIWDAGRGPVVLQFGMGISSDEACYREACLIESLLLTNLTNRMKGSFKYVDKIDVCSIGALLLNQAHQVLAMDVMLREQRKMPYLLESWSFAPFDGVWDFHHAVPATSPPLWNRSVVSSHEHIFIGNDADGCTIGMVNKFHTRHLRFEKITANAAIADRVLVQLVDRQHFHYGTASFAIRNKQLHVRENGITWIYSKKN